MHKKRSTSTKKHYNHFRSTSTASDKRQISPQCRCICPAGAMIPIHPTAFPLHSGFKATIMRIVRSMLLSIFFFLANYEDTVGCISSTPYYKIFLSSDPCLIAMANLICDAKKKEKIYACFIIFSLQPAKNSYYQHPLCQQWHSEAHGKIGLFLKFASFSVNVGCLSQPTSFFSIFFP